MHILELWRAITVIYPVLDKIKRSKWRQESNSDSINSKLDKKIWNEIRLGSKYSEFEYTWYTFFPTTPSISLNRFCKH